MRRLSIFNPYRIIPDNFSDEDWDLMPYPENELDMYEEGNNIVVVIKAPGFGENDIDATVEEGTLTITGKMEKKTEEENKDKKYYRKEISSQSFTRKVDLPVRVEAERANAQFKNGVLTLTLPKAKESMPKSIKISMGK